MTRHPFRTLVLFLALIALGRAVAILYLLWRLLPFLVAAVGGYLVWRMSRRPHVNGLRNKRVIGGQVVSGDDELARLRAENIALKTKCKVLSDMITAGPEDQ